MCVSVMKTAMTNFDIAAILPELRQHTIGSRIHNVYQITQTAFLLKLHPGNLNLIIEPAKRIHLTKYEVKTPPKPSQLCMAFRKHLKASKIVSIEQPNFERLIIIQTERQTGKLKLIVELLPRGNLIAVDERDRVLVSTHYARMRDRSILRGQPLQLPPQRGKSLFEAGKDDLAQLRGVADLDLARAFSQNFAVGGLLAEELMQRANIDKSAPAKDLTDDQIDRLSEAITELKDTLSSGRLTPAIIKDDSGPVDVVPFEFHQYKTMHSEPYSSFNDAVDEYFTSLGSVKQVQSRERLVGEKRQQLERRLAAQQSQLEEIVKSAKTLKDTGDIIFRHLNEIQAVLQIMADGKRSKRPADEIRQAIYNQNPDGSRVYPHVADMSSQGDKVTFDFDGAQIESEIRKRPQDQAAEYYEKAKRLESKLKGLRESIKKTEELLKKAASMAVEAGKPSEPQVRREKEWYEKFRWFRSSEQLLVIGGRDASSNETLLKRYANPEDVVMHAEIHGAPFFVVKTGDAQPNPETLKEAAQACVSYSRCWKDGVRSGDAYWVKPEQVTKSAPAGEYLTKGAFMIRGSRNYIRGVELALAVGLSSAEGRLLLMAGPPDAIKATCQAHIEIRQGQTSPAQSARRIIALLERKTDEIFREQLRQVSVDEVVRLLPPGGVEVCNSISP
jgi:predicted ribosome quality control (RQC) complex YloA/Tae2 family protein